MNIIPDFGWGGWSLLFYLFGGMVFMQLLYVLIFYRKLAFFNPKKRQQASELPPLSVIIAARNEADNIYENLPFILSQNYPEFEVIVVVNQSIDESKHILEAYQQQFKNLRFTVVERNKHIRPGKKLSLSIGIKAANYEHLVMTDADCKPGSANWLRAIGQTFNEQKKIVLGYGPYTPEKGFLNKVIRYDTAWIAVNYLSFALARMPYMGVGRNLAYTKSAFEQANGFKSHYSIASGDDDLFIQEAARKRNYSIVLSEDSYMYSPAEKTWASWYRQKARHYTTSPNYQVIKKTLLGIYPMTLLLMYISFITLLLNEDFRWLTLIIFGAILALKWWIQGKCFLRLKEKSFVAFFPFNDLLYAIGLPIMYYTGEAKTTNKW
ncbi:MAG: glycosyltransferase [Crocinitomicaceae bacterium]|nr:glycosyltransferase [Crocinitomicaceae bacterium]